MLLLKIALRQAGTACQQSGRRLKACLHCTASLQRFLLPRSRLVSCALEATDAAVTRPQLQVLPSLGGRDALTTPPARAHSTDAHWHPASLDQHLYACPWWCSKAELRLRCCNDIDATELGLNGRNDEEQVKGVTSFLRPNDNVHGNSARSTTGAGACTGWGRALAVTAKAAESLPALHSILAEILTPSQQTGELRS
jgi:hypothetical protein